MKRDKNIVPLSRDHHFGLLAGWKIRQGLKKGISYDRIRRFVNFHWETHQKQHFDEEERILFPYSDNEHTQQAIREHEEIREIIQAINQVEEEQLLTLFADKVTAHIRFEERTLFPYLEQALTPEQLLEVGAQLDSIHNDEEIPYNDEFWLPTH